MVLNNDNAKANATISAGKSKGNVLLKQQSENKSISTT